MQIEIGGSADFARLLDDLTDELVEGNVHFSLYQDLVAAYPEYAREFNQSNTFRTLTLTSHLDATIGRLCKAYDQHKTSLNLRNLLDTIRENSPLFDDPNFRERLKGNPFGDSLAETPRKPEEEQLQRDIESVSGNNPLVKKLTIWRNNFYSHRSREHALTPGALAKDYPLTLSDISTLLRNGMEVVNRYSNLFNATSYSTNIVGRSDYMSVLKAVREGLDAYEARVQREIRQLGSQT